MSQDQQANPTTSETDAVGPLENRAAAVARPPVGAAPPAAAQHPFSDPALVLALTFTANGLAG